MLVVFWIAAVLVAGGTSSEIQISQPFKTAEECAQAVERVRLDPEVVGASACYKVEIPPKPTAKT